MENASTEFHWAIPKISSSERYFLSQLISSPSKEVRWSGSGTIKPVHQPDKSLNPLNLGSVY